MLTIDSAILGAIVAHAYRAFPREACGIVAGPAETDTPVRRIPMRNTEPSTSFFAFDRGEQIRIWEDMDRLDERPVVIYHSHTASPPVPSQTDIALASDPRVYHLIVSVADALLPEIRAFRISGSEATEVEIEVVPSGELVTDRA